MTVSAKHALKVTLYARAVSSSKLPKIGVRVTTKIIGRAIIRQMFVLALPALRFKECIQAEVYRWIPVNQITILSTRTTHRVFKSTIHLSRHKVSELLSLNRTLVSPTMKKCDCIHLRQPSPIWMDLCFTE